MNNGFIIVADVSSSYFSVARHAGGATINGELFIYCPERDILVRDDWMKFYRRMPWDDFITAVKVGKKPILPKKPTKAKKEEETNQPSLFDQ